MDVKNYVKRNVLNFKSQVLDKTYATKDELANIGEGQDGKSPYELALEHGFEGTEEEWLASLQGRDGTDGTDGTDGVGIQGIAKTGTSGLVDTYTITLTNGSTSSFTVRNGKDGEIETMTREEIMARLNGGGN